MDSSERAAAAADGYLLDNRGSAAEGRFAALSALFDPVTFRHVDALGVEAGWRCWEVGAGGPSVPQGLAARVGIDGRVVATDIQTAWLAGTLGPGIEVRGARRRCDAWCPRCVPAAGCSSRTTTSTCSR